MTVTIRMTVTITMTVIITVTVTITMTATQQIENYRDYGGMHHTNKQANAPSVEHAHAQIHTVTHASAPTDARSALAK